MFALQNKLWLVPGVTSEPVMSEPMLTVQGGSAVLNPFLIVLGSAMCCCCLCSLHRCCKESNEGFIRGVDQVKETAFVGCGKVSRPHLRLSQVIGSKYYLVIIEKREYLHTL